MSIQNCRASASDVQILNVVTDAILERRIFFSSYLGQLNIPNCCIFAAKFHFDREINKIILDFEKNAFDQIFKI